MIAILLTFVFSAWSAPKPEFAAPFQVMANGKAISVEMGHAAPAYADMNADTVPDLIVGQFEGGTARIYRNHGTATSPVFKNFEFLRAAGKVASVDFG